MSNPSLHDEDMPAEIDFSKGVRGLHYIPADARVLMPASIEEIGEALKYPESLPRQN
jgi:hypothetical protein